MGQGCWTCRNRKVRCDLREPTCSNCDRAARPCLGYGLRLAWPRKGDKRRAMFYEPPTSDHSTNNDRISSELFFVNASSEDIDRSIHRSQWISQRNIEQRGRAYLQIQSLPLSQPVTWNLIDEKGRPPLNYYIQEGANMFASNQGHVLAPILLKIAVVDTSIPSTAVLHSILGLSSAHMGRHEEALAYRSSAVSLLSSSLGPGTAPKIAFQNIATSMMLCMFEIYYVSQTSRNWALYLCGIKNIILDALTEQRIDNVECIAIKDWVYYYEVLARFSVMHWIIEPTRYPICYEGPKSRLIQAARTGPSQDHSSTIGHSHAVFDCISDASDLVLSPRLLHLTKHERHSRVRELELRLRFIKSNTVIHDYDSQDNSQKTSDQLYLLAALVYLNQMGLEYSGEELYHTRLVEEALQLLSKAQASETPWPFFIIGCEARSDDQRRKVLGLAAVKKHGGALKHTPWLLPLIERFWAQEDLDRDEALSYVDKLSTVISTSSFLPAFA